jgi:hypothetical protein
LSDNPLKNARLTSKEIQATALHLVDGFSLRQIAAHMGGDHAAASRRVKSGIEKLLAAGAFPACVFRPLVTVTAVSKLGRAFESGNPDLNELAGD